MKKLFLLFLFFTLNIYGQDQICSEGQNMMVIQTGSLPSATAILRGDNEITIEYSNGEKKIKMLDYVEQNSFSKTTIDSTIIDIRTIDTTLYSNKYKFWQEIPVALDIDWTPIIGDVNNNGRPEIYGNEKYYSTPNPAPVVIFEMDTTQKFKKIHQYANNVNAPQTLVDFNNDGNLEIIMVGQPRSMVFKQDSILKLPITYQTKFGLFGSQTNDPTVSDVDKNGKNDIVYWSNLIILIEEFDKSKNSFDSIYSYYPAKNGLGGFSINDFDLDGKTDIVFGTVKGDVGVIETQGEHQYQVVWQSKVETYNAYLHFWTNDIDGNGKPEFWVGGDAFYNGVGITRFTCFETNGNNSYVPIAKIDMIGIFSFFAGNCFAKDIDKDGKQELFICLDGIVLIFKFTGSINSHSYNLLFAKRRDMDMINQNSVIYGATLYNITGDSKDELIIDMDQVVEGLGLRTFSRIYTLDLTMGIKRESEVIPKTTDLYQNYPNPFNSSTIITYQLPANSYVTLKVYDVLGKEVATLVNEIKTAGSYTIKFSAKGGSASGGDAGLLNSGMYFYTIKAGAYKSTRKMLLMK